jgi:hypothetical protein
MARGNNICYYTNGKGYWLRREWKLQCRADVFFSGRCQGVKGHKGVHWRYSPSGDFEWSANETKIQDACAGSTPPDNDEYVQPITMQEHYHVSHYGDWEVTDKAVIAMLERGKTPEGGAAIDRPVDFTNRGKKYFHLVITARTRKTVIWISDRKGFPVKKAIGKLDTQLVPGKYVVEFGQGKLTYPIKLKQDSEFRQVDVEKGPRCKRPIPKIDDDWLDD